MMSPLLWSTASNLGTQALAFVTFAVLARLLGAPAFGLVALAALVIDLLLVISNAGIAEAVVQRRTLDEAEADTAFWMNLASGLAFCLVTLAIAPWIARAFGQPQLTPIIRALSAIFAINPLGAIHTARLTRALDFRAVALRNVTAALTGAAIGVPLALAGCGAWALVGQRIAVVIALTVCAWTRLRWVPRPRFRAQAGRDLVRFGAYIGLSSTLNQVNIRIAEVISGALLGPVAVAFIRAGSRIVEVLNQVTYAPFQQIAMPLLARSAGDRALLQTTYLRLSRLSAFIMFPAFFGCLALAPQIVGLIFGPGWEPVADAIRIFACAVVASQMNNLIIATITALGQARTVLSWTSIQIGVGLAAAVLVHRWGWQAMLLTGVARGYLILPYGLHLLRRHTGISFTAIFANLRPALSSSAVMTVVVVLADHAYCDMLPQTAGLLIWLPLGAIVYLAAYLVQDRDILLQVRAILQARAKGA